MSFRVLDHTADTGVEVEAANPGRLFAEAGRGFAACITDLEAIESRVERSFSLSGQGLENLLIDWLGELLYVFDVKGEIFGELDVQVLCAGEGFRLEARALGEKFDSERHPLKVPVKAVTYHELGVWREENGIWRARVIFDI